MKCGRPHFKHHRHRDENDGEYRRSNVAASAGQLLSCRMNDGKVIITGKHRKNRYCVLFGNTELRPWVWIKYSRNPLHPRLATHWGWQTPHFNWARWMLSALEMAQIHFLPLQKHIHFQVHVSERNGSKDDLGVLDVAPRSATDQMASWINSSIPAQRPLLLQRRNELPRGLSEWRGCSRLSTVYNISLHAQILSCWHRNRILTAPPLESCSETQEEGDEELEVSSAPLPVCKQRHRKIVRHFGWVTWLL